MGFSSQLGVKGPVSSFCCKKIKVIYDSQDVERFSLDNQSEWDEYISKDDGAEWEDRNETICKI